RHGSRPLSELRARRIRDKRVRSAVEAIVDATGGKLVPIPDIEKFGAELDRQFFFNRGFFLEREVFIVIPRTPQVRDPGSGTGVKAVEEVRTLERRGIKERRAVVRIKAA